MRLVFWRGGPGFRMATLDIYRLRIQFRVNRPTAGYMSPWVGWYWMDDYQWEMSK